MRDSGASASGRGRRGSSMQADVLDLLLARAISPCTTGASPTMSTTRMRGLSDAYGSWKIICIFELRSRALSRARSPLQRRAAPEALAGRRLAAGPTASRPSVDLPQPDSPTRPTTSPAATVKSTSSTACTTSSRTFAPRRLRDARGEVERLHEALGDAAQLDQRRAGARAGGRVAARHSGCRHRSGVTGWATCASMAGASQAIGSSRARSARETRSPAAGRAATASCRESAQPPRRARCSTGTESSRPRVYGWRGRVEHLLDGALLDDAARVHHADAIGEARRPPRGRA